MNTKKEIQQLAETRLKEARILYDNAQFDGAIYLGGYSIELALKAAICKTLDVDSLFASQFNGVSKNFKTHDLNHLLLFAGLSKKFAEAKAKNPTLTQNWSRIEKWSEQKRYESLNPTKKTTLKDAQEFLDAIDNPKN